MKAARFDRDLSLEELLRGLPPGRLEAALDKLLGTRWQLLDAGNQQMRTSRDAIRADATAIPLRLDIDTVGKLVACDAPLSTVEAAAAWLELVLMGAARYHMAADLHVEAVNADYEALQKKHAALQESETRYRELSEQLEQRVKAQVDVIERSQRQLYQSEKLASVGSLAAGMAHEINNPIGFIRSNLATAVDYIKRIQAILSTYRSGDVASANQAWEKADMEFVLEDFPGLLDESVSGADRVARIVANLKKYASIDCALLAPLDINESVHAVAGIAATQIPERIKLSFDLHPLPAIVCDQSRINQMLLAIVQNAVLAISAQGSIRISTKQTGEEIEVAITDDGCGIAPDILNRIFDPFFTTREVGKGMGLGLAVARDIAVSHGGRIDVVSAPGAGSTFTVYLPLTQNTPSSREPSQST
jgi:signal transduction histidine kinase